MAAIFRPFPPRSAGTAGDAGGQRSRRRLRWETEDSGALGNDVDLAVQVVHDVRRVRFEGEFVAELRSFFDRFGEGGRIAGGGDREADTVDVLLVVFVVVFVVDLVNDDRHRELVTPAAAELVGVLVGERGVDERVAADDAPEGVAAACQGDRRGERQHRSSVIRSE